MKVKDTPLHTRIENGFGKDLKDFIDVLVPEYINAKGDQGLTPLMRCIISYGGSDWSIFKQLIETLLEKHADLSIRDFSGKTALHHAAESFRDGQERTITQIISKGPDMNARDNQGNTPLLSGFYSHSSTDNSRIIELLMDDSEDIDVVNNAGIFRLLPLWLKN